MATDRMDIVKENVFVVPSRINSTWGGTATITTPPPFTQHHTTRACVLL